MIQAGRYDFNDGGSYCGQWSDGKFQGYGVCTGPEGQGRYSGKWSKGFETSGTYTWPNGNTYEGCWSGGKIHGLGVETKEKWIYKGEWTRGLKGRYGSRYSKTSRAAYEGTWSTGLQDGYGIETYADGGTYQGQWFQGMRHGHGVRESVEYNHAIRYREIAKAKVPSTFPRNKSVESSLSSLHSEHDDHSHADTTPTKDHKLEHGRGGFVLRAKSSHDTSSIGGSSNYSGDENFPQKKSLFEKHTSQNWKRSLVKTLRMDKFKRRSASNGGAARSLPPSASGSPIRRTHGSMRSVASADSNKSAATDKTESQTSFASQTDVIDGHIRETYSGEWKNDKRCGYGICARSDGLKYTGEWFNNKKNGYGQTLFPDGSIEEGKYKNNLLITAMTNRKSSIFAIRAGRLREQIDSAVVEAGKASQIAIQKTEVAMNRMKVSRIKAEQASEVAEQARMDSATAHQVSTKSSNANIDLGYVDPNQIRYSISLSNMSDNEDKRVPDSQSHVQFIKKDSQSNNPIKQIFSNSFRHPSLWSKNNDFSINRIGSTRSNADYSTTNHQTFNSPRHESMNKLMSNNVASDKNVLNKSSSQYPNTIPTSMTSKNNQSYSPVHDTFQEMTRNKITDVQSPSSKFPPIDNTNVSYAPQMNVFERNRLKRNKDPIDIFIGGVPKTSSPSYERSIPFSPSSPSVVSKPQAPPRNFIPKTTTTTTTTTNQSNTTTNVSNDVWLRRYSSWLLLGIINLVIVLFMLRVLPPYLS